MQTILYLVLLALCLYPMADAGVRWLHSWVVFKLEIAGMTANSERCKSLNYVSGLCDWGADCLCWAEHVHAQDAANTNTTPGKTADMFECYPSNKANFTPVTKIGDIIKTPTAVEEVQYGQLWPEKANPGLVAEGTQPVEFEEEPFPGFSKHGG